MNPVIFGALIDLCLKKADSLGDRNTDVENCFSLAQDLFQEMQKLGIGHSIISLSLKIKLCNKLGDIDGAISCLDEIPRCNLK